MSVAVGVWPLGWQPRHERESLYRRGQRRQAHVAADGTENRRGLFEIGTHCIRRRGLGRVGVGHVAGARGRLGALGHRGLVMRAHTWRVRSDPNGWSLLRQALTGG